MKSVAMWTLVGVLILGIGMTGMAEETPTTAYVEDIFRIFSIEPFSGDKLLLGGVENAASSDTPGARIAVMDPSGTILWDYKVTEGSEQTRYDSVVQTGSDSVAALMDLRDQTGYIDFIEMDGETHRSALLNGPHKIFANDAGVLVNLLWEDATQLVQMDRDGNTLWTVDFEGYLYFDGILQGNDRIYAYGHEARTDFLQAKLVVLSLDGEVLNEVTDENKKEYTHGTMHEGQVLLLGGNETEGENWGVTCFDAEGEQIWHAAIPAEVDASASQRPFIKLSAIIPHADGFLVAAQGIDLEGSSVLLYQLDAEGMLLNEQELHTDVPGEQDHCTLLQLESGPCLVIFGLTEVIEAYDLWDENAPNLVDLPYGLYIQKIEI